MRRTTDDTETGASVRLRDAGPADAPALADLVEALNRSENDPTGYVTAATVRRDLRRGLISVVVAEHAGRLVGYCLYHFGYEATYAASGLYVVDLFVSQQMRRQGIARALLAEVARRAAAAGGTFLWWTSKPGNEAAHAAYAKLRAYSEPVVAHAVFDDAFEELVRQGRAAFEPE